MLHCVRVWLDFTDKSALTNSVRKLLWADRIELAQWVCCRAQERTCPVRKAGPTKFQVLLVHGSFRRACRWESLLRRIIRPCVMSCFVPSRCHLTCQKFLPAICSLGLNLVASWLRWLQTARLSWELAEVELQSTNQSLVRTWLQHCKMWRLSAVTRSCWWCGVPAID